MQGVELRGFRLIERIKGGLRVHVPMEGEDAMKCTNICTLRHNFEVWIVEAPEADEVVLKEKSDA